VVHFFGKKNLPSFKGSRTYEHLCNRVEEKQLDALFELKSEKSAMTTPPAASTDGTISIDDFSKVDLRVAKILKAEHVEGADKAAEADARRGQRHAHGVCRHQVGLRSGEARGPAHGDGRESRARKMKFGVSEGMVLAASGEGRDSICSRPNSGAQAGMKVK